MYPIESAYRKITKQMISREGTESIIKSVVTLFAEWLADTATWRNGPAGSKWYSIREKREDMTISELFDYWLKNIYDEE